MAGSSLKTSICYMGSIIALWCMTAVPYAIASVSVRHLRPDISNNVITLLCENDTTHSYIPNADIWRDQVHRVGNIMYGNHTAVNTSATIILTPQEEGDYFCGVASRGVISNEGIALLAYPHEMQGSTYTFTVQVGHTITITCPFVKGALSQYYSNRWTRGFSSLRKDDPHFIYSEETFDITIVNASFDDDNSKYFCHVNVDTPRGNDWDVSSRPITLHVTNETTNDKNDGSVTAQPKPTQTDSSPEYNTETERDEPKIATTVIIALAITVTVGPLILITVGIIIAVIAVRKCRKRRSQKLSRANSRSHSMSLNASSTSVRDLSLLEEHQMTPIPFSDQRTHTATSCYSSLYMKPLLSSEDYPPTSDVQFVGSIQIVPVDRMGGEYRNTEHSISVRIPKDSFQLSSDETRDRHSIDLEIGIAIHGHFRFPEGVSPVSAILWVNVAEEPDFEFAKEIEVDLPHYLQLNKSDLDSRTVTDNLGCMLAVTCTEETQDTPMDFVKDDGANVHFKQRSGKIKTRRACYMCLCAKRSFIETRGVYCLVSAIPRLVAPSTSRSILFFVCYHLSTFVEVIKEEVKSYEITQARFVFDSLEDAKIAIQFTEKSASKGWLLTLPMDTTEVSAKAVELWENDVSDLRLRLQHKLYPPRVKVVATPSRTAQNSQEVFTFTGTRYLDDRKKFSMQVSLFME